MSPGKFEVWKYLLCCLTGIVVYLKSVQLPLLLVSYNVCCVLRYKSCTIKDARVKGGCQVLA